MTASRIHWQASGLSLARAIARSSSIIAILFVGHVSAETPQPEPREIIAGYTTSRPSPGIPYNLAGHRLVFTNWYYVDPGDLDWLNKDGKSVYVDGNEAPDAAIYKGIRTPHGIHLRAHQPDIIGPFERPHRCIIQDGDHYRGWKEDSYYESADGIHWRFVAKLNLDPLFSDGLWVVFIDPTAPPEERYKTAWPDTIDKAAFDKFRARRPDGWEPRALLHLEENGIVSCIRGGYSADGITWKAYPDPLVVEYSDTLNIPSYDANLHKYVLYTRQWSIGERAAQLPSDIRNSWTGVGRRAIGRSETSDFRNFPVSTMIVEPGPEMLPSEVLYTNCYTSVPGAPDNHLMFPTIWNASVDDSTRVEMLSSHDGVLWHRLPGGNLFGTGEFGRWNGGCVWALPNLIELPDKSWALPYSAHLLPHKYPRGQQVGGLGYAVWPKGRLVSLDADDDGEFYTVAFIPPGHKLRINADTKRAGDIRVEIMGVDGRTLADCDPIFGDKIWAPVTWKGQDDIGVPDGKAIVLHVRMKNARLYGFQFD